ncbi:PREDICTED: UDP-glycosyltransferase 92A1-like [Nelumbo nucifera]|nr:PREDICTED: UDP-glycosyltransferase 92A1-like [Nelumbo nucifera]
MELAKALESSGKIFIWVLRPPIGFDVNEEFRIEEWLPDGFEERMRESNRGLLIRRWAPQLEILSHNSTCAFLSHCGWNSVLESLRQGVPIIGWPLAAEQFFNSKLLEEMEVCVEVARANSCEVGHEQIASVIELVMGGTEKGEKIRRKVCAVKEMIEDAVNDGESYKGSSVKAMDGFFDFCRRKIE